MKTKHTIILGAIVASQVIGGAAFFATVDAKVANALLPDAVRDQFGIPVPAACADFSPYILNRVLANSPLVKLTGVKVLEVLFRHPADRPHDGGITDCGFGLLLSSGGEVSAAAWTHKVNDRVYIQVQLQP